MSRFRPEFLLSGMVALTALWATSNHPHVGHPATGTIRQVTIGRLHPGMTLAEARLVAPRGNPAHNDDFHCDTAGRIDAISKGFGPLEGDGKLLFQGGSRGLVGAKIVSYGQMEEWFGLPSAIEKVDEWGEISISWSRLQQLKLCMSWTDEPIFFDNDPVPPSTWTIAGIHWDKLEDGLPVEVLSWLRSGPWLSSRLFYVDSMSLGIRTPDGEEAK